MGPGHLSSACLQNAVPGLGWAGYSRCTMGEQSQPKGTRPNAADTKPADPGTPSKDPARSPLLSAVRAGTGKLVPLAVRPTGMVVAIALPHPETGGLPPGTLLTVDEDVPDGIGMKNTLEAPVRSLAFATGHRDGLLSAGTITFAADLVLAQLQHQIHIANLQLDGMSVNAPSLAERVRARELLGTLLMWVQQAMMMRSGEHASAHLEVPQGTADAAVELARLGGRLRHYLREMVLARSPKKEGGGESALSDLKVPEVSALTKRERKILEILADQPAGQGLTGMQILNELPGRGLHGMTQSDLTTRLIRSLRKDGWNLSNRRNGAGYYLTETDRARFAKVDTRRSRPEGSA